MLLGVAVLAGCAQTSTAPLQQEAYIWQRQWTPALRASVEQAYGHFSAWRVLAVESAADGTLTEMQPDLETLAQAALPVVAVVRVNGNSVRPSVAVLEAKIVAVVMRWRAAGLVMRGMEIDYDCATSQLSDYAQMLRVLRQQLAPDLQLSITALPTWIGSPALVDVLNAIDASVLQVHAVTAPTPGAAVLIDTDAAQRWIQAYAEIATKVFSVALPAYGLRVGFDSHGGVSAVAAEATHEFSAEVTREIAAPPEQIAQLLVRLRRGHPKNLTGIVWFRLPTRDDARAWSLTTLLALVDGAPLQARIVWRAEGDPNAAREIVLVNTGDLDAPLPDEVKIVASGCTAADGLAGYGVQSLPKGYIFTRVKAPDEGDAILRAGRELHIGWVRCKTIELPTSGAYLR